MSRDLACSEPVADEASATRAPIDGNDALFAKLYDELHRIARRELARSGPDVMASPTTLLHEAYLDMAGRSPLVFPDRPRFLAYAGRAMRARVIDQLRARGAHKRGGDLHLTSLDTHIAEQVAAPRQLADIGGALDELAELEPELANVVDLKFFCGFGVAEIAALQGVSERTVQRRWEKARALLFRAIGGSP
ncbi:ECF-type sigma factor [Scleromatobacter humisilvae]|uniref:Sigma-70 family RNA polymerase sigma factor n=1 Tax=Scleromatobacter humisilvae TaxID=2897159 RepID=A0A9X1YHD5_9BURK|nr:ECF-type sigma factor [Scleromatobacter humisilvae]MCK9685455.1 sigma-70 family RNA polymerase sigma factor [Scleromatobacter humisilvae]